MSIDINKQLERLDKQFAEKYGRALVDEKVEVPLCFVQETMKMAEDNMRLLKIISAINTKLNRWQKVIDVGIDARNPFVQKARDEVMQECINTIRDIVNNPDMETKL
ncbi:MAG: hypothetical protein KJO69_05530 [Gammaproteobacteria bacterium]|nr:hypothetical protein [Gammaproteobacteria bacterium]